MPYDPEDDWTRPMPRTPRPGRGRGHGAGRDPRSSGGDDWRRGAETERIPRQDRYAAPRRGDERAPGRGDRYDERYDERYDDRGRADGRYDDRGDRYVGSYGRGDDRYDERHDERYDERGRYDERDRYAGQPDRRPGGRGAPPPRPPRRRRRYGMRRFMALLVLLLVGYVVAMVVVATLVWGSINRIDSAPDVADRPASGSGANYLLVGTDSREELTDEQRGDFGTGYTEGSRADTVMLLHVPDGGDPTLVSLPRDSFVHIRDHGQNKLNAAHSQGGPELLVDTVEQNTGLRVDGYLEIGFGGFVGVVDKVGGVNMCLDEPIQDDKAHLDLPAGCQDLTGPEALGYVRMRYSDPRGDIGRVERQREFLSALVSKMASPGTVLNPVRFHQVGTATGRSLAMGEDTSMIEAVQMGLAMRAVAGGKGHSLTVPVADANYSTTVGSTVLWDEAGAAELFGALREGRPVPVAP